MKGTIVEVIIIPTQAAKRIGSLKNVLFHEWKERVRQYSSLTHGQAVDKDCLFPLNHRHFS
jgi:hypothetical protein